MQDLMKNGMNLKWFDTLEVGPIKVEPRQLSVPYRVVTQGSRFSNAEFLLEYEEDVFDVDDPTSMNLASLIAIQPALNYAMFANTVIFRGHFDNHDRRMIRNQGETIAREVYINRLVEPNPFLKPELEGWIAPTKKNLLRTDLQVTGGNREPYIQWDQWVSSRDRHAVIVDGSRGSLLSLGILRELGCPTFALLVRTQTDKPSLDNELYSTLKERSQRDVLSVQTNLEDLYGWFLSLIPTLRSEYEDIRHRNPPFRVWQKSVKLFSLLPIIKKHNIRRIVQGHDYESTQKDFVNNVPHHDGLYESSYFNDTIQSRFFQQKGWRVHQFSFLRSLTQQLMEKMLIERYPELHALASSCLRPVSETQEVRRCGWCVECRIHQALLVAYSVDPTKLGYQKEQTHHAIESIVARRLYWKDSEIDALLLALQHQHAIALKPNQMEDLAKHAVPVAARFAREKSPINAIPDDLREPIFSIFLQHFNSTLMRVGRGWKEFDPFSHDKIRVPYPFEVDSDDSYVPQSGDVYITSRSETITWGELSWPEAHRRLENLDLAILPVGSIAQQGPHLPLDTSGHLADELARRAVAACEQPQPLILPLVPFGVSRHHEDFAGTVSLSNDTFVNLIYDVAASVARNGVHKLLIINHDQGNVPALHDVAQRISQDLNLFVCVDSGESYQVDAKKVLESENDVHAGEFDTSLSLFSRPSLVNMELARRTYPQFTSRYLNFRSHRKVPWFIRTKKQSLNGIMGDPTKANIEKGEKLWDLMLAHTVALIEDLKALSLDELHPYKN
ncbi:MAG: creatininase family protein [Deltaproteobacteria bacterium]|nr:MAG: creatininase family protein [Deltaproteobacteria bacterium]